MNTIPSFTASHAALLARFLSSPQRPNDTLNYPQLGKNKGVGNLFSPHAITDDLDAALDLVR